MHNTHWAKDYPVQRYGEAPFVTYAVAIPQGFHFISNLKKTYSFVTSITFTVNHADHVLK